MDDVKSWNVIKLFSKDKKDGISKFDKLGQVIDVGSISCWHSCICVVHGLTLPTILPKPSFNPRIDKDESTQKYHQEIVDNHGTSQVERFSISHQSWTKNFDRESVRETDSECWQRWLDQWPVMDSWITSIQKHFVIRGYEWEHDDFTRTVVVAVMVKRWREWRNGKKTREGSKERWEGFGWLNRSDLMVFGEARKEDC